ncbi:hypothetical protein GGR56DRAFT_73317 [Xylariaceae sp. FL0804]|nr:hypothetical protein GGR56DRAFT_73317 [Xylariaceae sp. FL0804]
MTGTGDTEPILPCKCHGFCTARQLQLCSLVQGKSKTPAAELSMQRGPVSAQNRTDEYRPASPVTRRERKRERRRQRSRLAQSAVAKRRMRPAARPILAVHANTRFLRAFLVPAHLSNGPCCKSARVHSAPAAASRPITCQCYIVAAGPLTPQPGEKSAETPRCQHTGSPSILPARSRVLHVRYQLPYGSWTGPGRPSEPAFPPVVRGHPLSGERVFEIELTQWL